jgi:hypothetical protein
LRLKFHAASLKQYKKTVLSPWQKNTPKSPHVKKKPGFRRDFSRFPDAPLFFL